MEWVERLNQSMNYIEENLTMNSLDGLLVALPITIRECLLIWWVSHWQNISEEEKYR